jgi:DNA-binding NtrC family response regulator
MSMAVLIVESNLKDSQRLAESIRQCGRVPITTDSIKSAVSILRKESPDLVMLSINGFQQRVVDFLQASQALEQQSPVIIVTDKACLDDATQMMKLGAYDYWVKPVQSERLAKTLELLELRSHPADDARLFEPRPIIGQNPRMLQLKTLAQRIAATSATVFIQGESGTGKEVLARFIHQHSERSDKPFLALNCAALPEGLLESELFGHEKGAFTGAIKAKEGKFELANNGTLLLDEITEIPTHLQAKLLRVLQENEVDRVGGRYPVAIDVRVIATTNTDVEQAISQGQFRKDLYYRLNVIPLKIPPLRDRLDDIPLLAQHFMERYNRVHKRQLGSIAPTTMRMLQEHSWPGNVRELENVMQRAVLFSTTPELTPDCLLFDSYSTPHQRQESAMDLMPISQMERLMIDKALETVQGNRTRAAEILGISVRTLRNKLQEYRQTQAL